MIQRLASALEEAGMIIGGMISGQFPMSEALLEPNPIKNKNPNMAKSTS